MDSFEFCPLTDSKTDILKDLSGINTSSEQILKSINKIKANLQNSNCDIREKSEEQTEQLKKIKKLFTKYKKERYTDFTNKELKKLFNSIDSNLNNLDKIWNNIENIIYLDKKWREDTFYENNTLRDIVEKNVNFVWEYIHWTYNETPEMENFLNIFTIEYSNFLSSKKLNKYVKINSKLLINKKDLTLILLKVQNKIKVKLNFEIEFNLIWSKEKIIINDFIEQYKKEKIEANKTEKEERLFIKKIENDRRKNIQNLFTKYYWNKTVNSRKDINSLEFTKKLNNAFYRKEISLEIKKQILEYGFEKAYEKEIKFWDWKKWFKNIKKYEKIWKNIFYNELKNIIKSKEKAESLFLISWIESNWQDKKENPYWAIWRFQILLKTAKWVFPSTTTEDLHNPIKSAKIAAKYLKKLIIEIKSKNPKYNDEQLISDAITKYNWWLIRNFKEIHKKNIKKTLYDIYKELFYIKSNLFNNSKSQYKNINNIIKILKNVRNKFFSKKSIENWKKHFWIFEYNNPTKKDISEWIERYLTKIIIQQDMYSIQFNAINKLYKKIKKAN